MLSNVIIFYLLLVNVTSLLLMASDKKKAQKGQWRIAERTLFLAAFLGGSIGMYLGMYLFHHKTKKPLFRFGIPAILFFQVLIVVLIFCQQNHIISFM